MRDSTLLGFRFWMGVALVAALLFSPLLIARARASTHRPAALHGDVVWTVGQRLAPTFQLRDERGKAVSLAAERGRVVLLTFMYSRCRESCPIEGRLLAEVEHSLGRATHSVLLIVSVDPGGDTPATIRRFVARAGLTGTHWSWLVGSRPQLASVWRAYEIDVRAGHDIGHSAALYLIDRQGFERAGYAVPFLPKLAVADVRTLEGTTARR